MSNPFVSGLKLIDRGFKKLEPGKDKLLSRVLVNSAGIAGAYSFLSNSDLSDASQMAGAALTGVATVAANKFLFSEKGARRSPAHKFSRWLNRNRPATWAFLAGSALGTYQAGQELAPAVQDVYQDVKFHVEQLTDRPLIPSLPREGNLERITREGRPEKWRAPPIGMHELGYAEYFSPDFSGTRLLPKQDPNGNTLNNKAARVQRIRRFEPIFEAVAAKYSTDGYAIPTDVLMAMGMEESYGDPMQPNSGDDGGLGLLHIQGTTAQAYGLDIHGRSDRDSDRRHGRQLRQIIEDCREDLSCVEEFDERAHIVKNIDAAARIIREGMERSGSTNVFEGVRYYRGGSTRARNTYESRIRQWQDALNDRAVLEHARESFRRLNGTDLDTYWKENHEATRNWELDAYKELRGE